MREHDIEINETYFWKHPVYNHLWCNLQGEIWSSSVKGKKSVFCKDKPIRKLNENRSKFDGNNRYKTCSIGRIKGKIKVKTSHRIIMECILDRILDRKETVNHINHKHRDNRVSNLEVCSLKENIEKYHDFVKFGGEKSNISRCQ